MPSMASRWVAEMVHDLPIVGLPGVRTREELREYVISHGCFSAEENARIYEKWYARSPRYLFRAVDRKYRICQRVLCDVGCSHGMNLAFCAPGSYGIELDTYAAQFAASLGANVYERDVENDDLSNLPKADVVWCSAVLEHVDSPHLFLCKLRGLLRPSGLLAVYVPTLPILPWLRWVPGIGRYVSGHQAADHVNAFVPRTLRFFAERAGFETLEVSPFYPGMLRAFNRVPLLNQLVDGCIYVGQKVDAWDYPEKATRQAAANHRGFTRKVLVAGSDVSERR